jgi:hypothetical protein
MAALSLSPLAAAVVIGVGPRLPVPDSAADALAALGAVLPPTVGLTWAARHGGRLGATGALALAAALAMAIVHFTKLPPALVPLQVFGITALAHAGGDFIGRRIQHPGHVLPATWVAAAADVASVFAPQGPTGAIARSEEALPLFAIAGGVPGTAAVTFVLGVGDLVMLALVAAAAAKFGVSLVRVAVAAFVAFAVAIAASAVWATPVPALVPFAVFVPLFAAPLRRVDPKDRSAAAVALVVSVAVAAFLVLRRP